MSWKRPPELDPLAELGPASGSSQILGLDSFNSSLAFSSSRLAAFCFWASIFFLSLLFSSKASLAASTFSFNTFSLDFFSLARSFFNLATFTSDALTFSVSVLSEFPGVDVVKNLLKSLLINIRDDGRIHVHGIIGSGSGPLCRRDQRHEWFRIQHHLIRPS